MILYKIRFTTLIIQCLLSIEVCQAFNSASAHKWPYITKHWKKSQESLCVEELVRKMIKTQDIERVLVQDHLRIPAELESIGFQLSQVLWPTKCIDLSSLSLSLSSSLFLSLSSTCAFASQVPHNSCKHKRNDQLPMLCYITQQRKKFNSISGERLLPIR